MRQTSTSTVCYRSQLSNYTDSHYIYSLSNLWNNTEDHTHCKGLVLTAPVHTHTSAQEFDWLAKQKLCTLYFSASFNTSSTKIT